MEGNAHLHWKVHSMRRSRNPSHVGVGDNATITAIREDSNVSVHPTSIQHPDVEGAPIDSDPGSAPPLVSFRSSKLPMTLDISCNRANHHPGSDSTRRGPLLALF